MALKACRYVDTGRRAPSKMQTRIGLEGRMMVVWPSG